MKKAAIITAIVLASSIVFCMIFAGYLILSEYQPKNRETIAVSETGLPIHPDKELSVLTYNIGYAGLSKDEDFFMDGGKNVRPDDETLILANLEGISHILDKNAADIILLQEVDLASRRSYGINQQAYLTEQTGKNSLFAYNFNCKYVPYPLPPIGKVESGLLTLSGRKLQSAARIALPVPFPWPVSTCNLKRCLLETRFPIEGSSKELIVFNLHLEAYDDGEGKVEQTNVLMQLLHTEYEKGNYVIAGGDFNQTFDSIERYPIINKDSWMPGKLEEASLPDGFSFAVSDQYATCRLLNAPYSGNYMDSQVYVIDGYIVSDNIDVKSVQVIDTQFEYSDHQPVKLSFCFKND